MAADPLHRKQQISTRTKPQIAPALLMQDEAILIRKLRSCSKETQAMIFAKVDQIHADTLLYPDLDLESPSEQEPPTV